MIWLMNHGTSHGLIGCMGFVPFPVVICIPSIVTVVVISFWCATTNWNIYHSNITKAQHTLQASPQLYLVVRSGFIGGLCVNLV